METIRHTGLRAAALAFGALLAGCLLAGCQTVDEIPNDRLGYAQLRKPDGSVAGFARLLSNGGEIDIAVALTDVPEGRHGVHLHTVGACDAPDFASAGGHLNPSGREHGSDNPRGPHLGDLPNAPVGSAGTGNMSATLNGTVSELLPSLLQRLAPIEPAIDKRG